MVSAEQPFLFYPEGHDVRWRSFAEIAVQAAAGAAALAQLGLAAGARVAYRWRPGPDAVAADLAIRAGGWTAVPVPVRAAAPVTADERWVGSVEELDAAARELGCAALLLAPGVEPGRGGAGLPRAALPEAEGGGSTGGTALLPEVRGSALLRGADRVLSGEEIAAAGDRLEARLGALGRQGGRSAGRRVVVACFDVSTADGRALLAWAERTAPALFLEPDRGSLAGSAAWARSTVVAGEAEPVARLAADVRRHASRPPLLRRSAAKLTGGRAAGPARLAPRGPYGRLRAVVLLGGGLGADALATFAQHRVAVLRPDPS